MVLSSATTISTARTSNKQSILGTIRTLPVTDGAALIRLAHKPTTVVTTVSLKLRMEARYSNIGCRTILDISKSSTPPLYTRQRSLKWLIMNLMLNSKTQETIVIAAKVSCSTFRKRAQASRCPQVVLKLPERQTLVEWCLRYTSNSSWLFPALRLILT